MAEQGPLNLFLGNMAKVVFSEAGSNKTLTFWGKVTNFDDQSIVLEKIDNNPNKKITLYVTRNRISHLKMEEFGGDF